MIYIRSYIKHFFSITLIALSVLLNAQEPVYKHYTVEDGLPSSEVYSAFQDSKGYMWFATDAGVSRFNGYEFENFDTSDGLTDNTVFLIIEDYKGRIWFGTFNSQLSYYDYKDDKIYPYKYNKELSEQITSIRALETFCVDSNDNVWLGYYHEGIFRCNENGKTEQMIHIPEGMNSVTKSFIINNQIINGFKAKEKYAKILDNNKQYKHKNELDFGDLVLSDTIGTFYGLKRNRPANNIHVGMIDNYYFITFFNEELVIKKVKDSLVTFRKPFSFLKGKRINSFATRDNFIWICTNNNGIYKCTVEKDQLVLKDHLLASKSISRTYRDREGGIWVMILNEGVYYTPNENIKILKTLENSILAIEIDTISKELFISYEDGAVIKTSATKKSVEPEIISQLEHPSYTLKYDYSNESLLIGGIKEHFEYYKNDRIHFLTDVRPIGTKSFLIDGNYVYSLTNLGLSILKKEEGSYRSYLNDGLNDVWGIDMLKMGEDVWIGTNEGIKIYKNGKITTPFPDNKYLSTSITSLERLNEKLFIVGTKSYGALIMNKDSIIDIIDEEDGLVGNLVKKIHIDNEKVIWVGTNNGLSKIEYKNDNFTIYNLTKKQGLASEEITDLCSYKNKLYLSTPKGLMEFDKTKLAKNILAPPVYITDFEVNSKAQEIGSNMNLTYQQNFIKIYFEALNYRSVGEVEYQYRMVGIDTNWISTTTRSVQYPSLQHGEYTFEVKAKNEDGYWSEPTKLYFVIRPPFWLTWWFIGLEIIVGLLIIYLIFKYRERQLMQKNEAAQKIIEAEKKMVELELKALRSQMNPHFIFNTLNSIQHYIATNDFKSTNKYLTQFAKLIRTVLNLSEKNVITIQEEIEMLELYMDLERMRFDEAFSYEINVAEEIDIDYDEVPSMLIQPYVENAIWHGLMNKSGKGKIIVKMTMEGKYMCFSIEDNGIGRKKAAEIQAKRQIKRKSVGMSITKERLDIINNEDISVEIEDIKDTFGNEMGTKVKIKVVYKNGY